MSSRQDFAIRGLENCVNPAMNGYLFQIRQRKERDGLGFHLLCPRYSWTLTPIAPIAIRLWETFTVLLLRKLSVEVIPVLQS